MDRARTEASGRGRLDRSKLSPPHRFARFPVGVMLRFRKPEAENHTSDCDGPS
jgi:hypothetical protein